MFTGWELVLWPSQIAGFPLTVSSVCALSVSICTFLLPGMFFNIFPTLQLLLLPKEKMTSINDCSDFDFQLKLHYFNKYFSSA